MPDLKRPFRWIARNARPDTDGEPVPIALERNREAAVEMGAQNPPDVPLYRFRIGLRAGFSGSASPGYTRVMADTEVLLAGNGYYLYVPVAATWTVTY